MSRAVRIDADRRGAEPRAKWITAKRHADAVFHRTGRAARLVPFFTKADALGAFEDALLQIVRRESKLTFRFLCPIAHKHIERIDAQLEGDLIQKRREAEYRLRVGRRFEISGDHR